MRGNILAFVLGVWLLQQQAALPVLLWAWALAPLLLARSLPESGRVLPVLRWILLRAFWVGIGFFWAALFAQIRLADTLPPAWEGQDIRLAGVVAALPAQGEHGTRFEFDVEKVFTPEAVVPRHIQLNWLADDSKTPEPVPAIHAGERWQLTVRLKRPHGTVNPNGFDFEAWALERNLRALGYVRKDEGNRRVAGLVYRPGYLIERGREKAMERFRTVLGDRPYAGALAALAIGEQGAIPPAQWQVFLRTGVTHLMSISGLHVTMISGLLAGLVYWVWRRSPALTLRLPARKAAVLAGVLAALTYAWLAGFGVPTRRTVFMLAVVALALWLGRMASASRVLALALLAVVLFDPWAVLSPGFWLSFVAVAAILYVSAGRLGKPAWWQEGLRVQWAVTLGLLPATLLLFQQVSIISPVANAFAIPVISLVVVPLTLAGTLLPLDFLLLLAHQVMALCMGLLTWLAGLPDAVWQQHAPTTWSVLAALAGVLWLLLPRGVPARWLGAVGLLPMFVAVPPQPGHGDLWLTVLDVGQGLAVVAQTERHSLLYDTGPRFSNEADSGNRIVVPFLRAAGIRKLDGMIVTHNDSDHSGGALSVLQALPVGWFASSLPADHPAFGLTHRAVSCFAGQSWEWDGVRFEMLHPTWESYRDPELRNNARGCVLKITSAHGSALLTADIEQDSEQELLARNPDALRATMLTVPHHGSRTSSTEAFIRQVNPALAVFTVGYRNRFGHPRPDVVRRYREQGMRLLRSDWDGAVLLRFDHGGMATQTWRQAEPRYWRESGDGLNGWIRGEQGEKL